MDNLYVNAHEYDNIINTPHHQSYFRPHMSNYDRAAQFSPFAALTGYEDAVKESSRLTAKRFEHDEYSLNILNKKLNIIKESLAKEPNLSIVYFVSDKAKTGGSYVTHLGAVRRIDEYAKLLIMKSGSTIPIGDIFEISGDIFSHKHIQ